VAEYTYHPLNRFSDTTANEELEARRADLDLAKKCIAGGVAALADQWLKEAKENRAKTDRTSTIESACRYLLLAQHGATQQTTTTDTQEADTVVEHFHRAANELRRVDLLERSAQAYFNAGYRALQVTVVNKGTGRPSKATFELGVRSAGRAKALFDALGEEEKADTAHALRLDIIRRQKRHNGDVLSFLLLLVWGGLTRYGTSPSRWLGTLLIALIVMVSVYASAIGPVEQGKSAPPPHLALHNGLGSNSAITAPFLAVVNLFAFGGYTNVTPQSWIGQLALLAQTIVSFFWLGTGVTFLTRR
jgi:hypothetical protein